MIVAIHQPNYLPWLGYFKKLIECEVFIFLDDAQFSKQSFINRVKILGSGEERWLLVPISVSRGQTINQVLPAKPKWIDSHLDIFRGFYREVAAFNEIQPHIIALFSTAPTGAIAAINRHLIEGIAERLEIQCRFLSSSELDFVELTSDDRLVSLTAAIDAGAVYLSGQEGAKYQDESKFAEAGLDSANLDFKHLEYDQGLEEITPGLSIIDGLYHLGWEKTAALLQENEHIK